MSDKERAGHHSVQLGTVAILLSIALDGSYMKNTSLVRGNNHDSVTVRVSFVPRKLPGRGQTLDWR